MDEIEVCGLLISFVLSCFMTWLGFKLYEKINDYQARTKRTRELRELLVTYEPLIEETECPNCGARVTTQKCPYCESTIRRN